MPKWLNDLLAEYAVIAAAPRSFVIATITLTGALVLAAWGALDWKYGGLLAGKDQQISILRDRITALEQRPSAPPAGPQNRNPDSLYQYDEDVGSVVGALISQGNGLVTFQAVRSSGKLDASKEVEFRDYVLMCSGLPPAPPPNVITGVAISVSSGVQCTIIRRRSR
jgi:hypothetical protein